MTALRLADPHVRFHRSFLDAHDELVAAGEEHYVHLPSWPADATFGGIEFTRADLEHRGRFADLAAFLRAQRRDDEPRPAHVVAFTELWVAEGSTYLGRISLRHELTPLLHTWGGHVGYVVRPSARRRGLATWALGEMLVRCGERGIDPVLVTCDEDNVASRRTIEHHGGAYEDSREGKRRYWVPAR